MKTSFLKYVFCLVILHLIIGINLPAQSQSKVDVDGLRKQIRDAKDELDKIMALDKIRQVNKQLSSSDKAEISKEIISLLSDPKDNVRSNTAMLLGELGAKKYAKDIAELLDDANVVVKTGATIALGNLGAAEYSQDIAGYLTHKDAGLRGAAAEALGRLGATEYIKDITALLGDSDSSVKDKATKALVKLSERQPKKTTDEPKSDVDKDWRSDKWGFKVTLPSDWEMNILDKSEGILVAKFSDLPNGISGLITKDYFDGGADDYLKSVLEELKKGGGIEVITKPKGKSAATLVYTYDAEDSRYQYYAHVIDVDGTKFRMVFYCSAKIYDKYEDIFINYSDTLEGIAVVNKNVKVKDKKWASEKWGFEITLPSDWKMDILDKDDEGTVAYFSKEDDGLKGLITTKKSKSRADEYLKDILNTMKEEYGIEIVQAPKGKSEATTVFIGKFKEGYFQYYIHIIDADGVKIRVAFWCKKSIYDENKETFEKYAETLKALDVSSVQDNPAETKVWRSSRWGFEVALPSDWEMDILDKIDGIKTAEFSNDEKGVYGIIAQEESETDCDEYLSSLVEEGVKDGTKEIVLKAKGKSDATLVYIYDISGTKYESYIRVIDVAGIKLMLVFYCKKSIYRQYENSFKDSADTLKGW